MKLSLVEIKVMDHLQDRFPKDSSLKQLNEVTKRSREDLQTALEGLKALTLISVSKKNEVRLSAAGKEYLGLNAKTSSNEATPVPTAKKQSDNYHVESFVSQDKAPTQSASVETPIENKSPLADNVVVHELNFLTRKLNSPNTVINNKAQKVDLLVSLSENLKSNAPYISEQLLEIANVIHALENAA